MRTYKLCRAAAQPTTTRQILLHWISQLLVRSKYLFVQLSCLALAALLYCVPMPCASESNYTSSPGNSLQVNQPFPFV